MPRPATLLCLEVDRGELLNGLRAIQAAEKHERFQATVWFDGERVRIDFGEVQVSAGATGSWVGHVRVRAALFKIVRPSERDDQQTITLRLLGDKFMFGDVGVPCTWRGGRP